MVLSEDENPCFFLAENNRIYHMLYCDYKTIRKYCKNESVRL